MGRPGVDPGTLGLKEGCIWLDSSGGVGIIRISKKIDTFGMPATSRMSAKYGGDLQRVCSPFFPTRFSLNRVGNAGGLIISVTVMAIVGLFRSLLENQGVN